jgi:hypothetical protein
MHKLTKKFVAILCGIATLVGPTTALAEGTGFCTTYMQVRSNGTGGEYVGGLLKGETERTETREYYINTTVESEVNGGGVVVTASTSGSVGSGEKITRSETFDIGYYEMNDGSLWEVNCDTGAKARVR